VEDVDRPRLEDVELRLVVGEPAEEPRQRLLSALEQVPDPETGLPESLQQGRAHLVPGQLCQRRLPLPSHRLRALPYAGILRPAQGWATLDSTWRRNLSMSGATYKSIELVGTSPDSYADATRRAVRRASETMRNLRWFEVVEQRGHIGQGDVTEFQVRLRVWFSLEA